MSKRLLTLLVVLLVAAVGLPAAAAAGGDGAMILADGKAVAKSPTGSYIVVMAADPLLADFEQDDLTSPAAQREARKLQREQEKALEKAGVAKGKKTNGYTNALNGFSAVLDYDEALALAAQPEVMMVLPDELRQPTTDNSPTFLGLTGPAGAWQTGYDGEGVVGVSHAPVVGFVDFDRYSALAIPAHGLLVLRDRLLGGSL